MHLEADSRYEKLQRQLTCPCKIKEAMSHHTTFQVGGFADFFVLPSTVDDLTIILRFCHEHDIPFYIIGWGSNLLVSDLGFPGIIINFRGNMDHLNIDGERVVCGPGLSLQKLIRITRENDLVGLDFMYGIPGTIGGITYMNAGSNSRSISELIISVKSFNLITLKEETFMPNELDFSYRHSRFFNHQEAILSVSLLLQQGDKVKEIIKLNEAKDKRMKTQPLQYPNAGCIWKNPAGMHTGKLIENEGLKGYQWGGAKISNLHANFIINHSKATAADIYYLICYVEKIIFEQYGILLEREIQLVGEFY